MAKDGFSERRIWKESLRRVSARRYLGQVYKPSPWMHPDRARLPVPRSTGGRETEPASLAPPVQGGTR